MLCAADAQALLRLGHGNASGCHDRFVQPGQDRTTVTYSCAADGWGRSELRRETPELYQLDTQGIAHRQPFAFRAEARRIGSCPGTGQNLPRRYSAVYPVSSRDRKSTRLNSSHYCASRMPSSARKKNNTYTT